jgi:hypothetical protein
VEGGLLLDVVVGQGAAVLQLLAGKDQALLVRGDAWWFGGGQVGRGAGEQLNTSKGDGESVLSMQNAAATQPATRANSHASSATAWLKRANGNAQALTLLVLDLLLDILDGVGGLHLEGDGLAREGLDEDLHRACGEEEDGQREWEEGGGGCEGPISAWWGARAAWLGDCRSNERSRLAWRPCMPRADPLDNTPERSTPAWAQGWPHAPHIRP